MSLPRTQPDADAVGHAQETQGPSELDALSWRMRSDYEEMPGLSLTARQAAHLYGASCEASQGVLRSLVEMGYLREGSTGYVRVVDASSARRQFA